MEKVIEIKESEISRTVSLCKTRLFTTIEKVKDQYRKLNVGRFDQQAFEDVICGNLSATRSKYNALVNEDLKQFKSSVVASVAVKSVDELFQPLEQLQKELLDAMSRMTIDLSWDDIEIINEAPQIRMDQLRRRYSVIIDSEEKEQLYEKMQTVTKAWNDLRDFVNKAGYDTGRYPFFGYGGFIHVSDSSKLEMNLDGINALNSVRKIEEAGRRL